METLAQAIAALTILATAVMAASAAIQAVRHDFDPFGATVLAIASAVGGGTLRDLLLGLTPVFWIGDLRYLATAIPVGLGSYFLARRLPSGQGRRLRWLMRLDAVGLALFTLLGARIALDSGTSGAIAVIIGCITGTVGGMIRDILCNVTPSILKEDLYATISLAGGAVYLGLLQVTSDLVALCVSFAVILLARLAVLR